MTNLLLSSRNTCPYLQKIAQAGVKNTDVCNLEDDTELELVVAYFGFMRDTPWEALERMVSDTLDPLRDCPRAVVPHGRDHLIGHEFCHFDGFTVCVEPYAGHYLITMSFLTPKVSFP